MDKVFKEKIGRNMEVCVDDMIVKSCVVDEHVKNLEEVFAKTKKYDLRLNPEKCDFSVKGGKFLGFMLTNRGIEAYLDKCEEILNKRSPTNLKEVQRLVGRLNALAIFFPVLAERSKSIIKLLRKAKAFKWNEQCKQTFSTIKKMIDEPPILVKPVSTQPIIVYLATSHEAIGVALIQEYPKQKSIYFVSRALQNPETRYQLVEKIALTLVYIARRLRPYFLNHQIIVRTDCSLEKKFKKTITCR